MKRRRVKGRLDHPMKNSLRKNRSRNSSSSRPTVLGPTLTIHLRQEMVGSPPLGVFGIMVEDGNPDISSKLNLEISNLGPRGKGLEPAKRSASPRQPGRIQSPLIKRSPAAAVEDYVIAPVNKTLLL